MASEQPESTGSLKNLSRVVREDLATHLCWLLAIPQHEVCRLSGVDACGLGVLDARKHVGHDRHQVRVRHLSILGEGLLGELQDLVRSNPLSALDPVREHVQGFSELVAGASETKIFRCREELPGNRLNLGERDISSRRAHVRLRHLNERVADFRHWVVERVANVERLCRAWARGFDAALNLRSSVRSNAGALN